jgi:O-antigen ligase
LFALIISATGIIQVLKIISESKYNLELLYSITGNFAQKNIFSEVLFIAFAFSVYGISIFEKLWKKAAIVATLLTLLLIAFLMTRAIWIAFFVSFIFSILLYIFYSNKSQLSDKLKPIVRYFFIILGVAILAVVVILVVDKNKTIQTHLANTTNIKEGNNFHRLNLWKKSLSLAQQHPILGVGAGNWRIEILQYDMQVTTNKGRIMPDRAHNDYLQVLAENGIIGLLSLLLLFAFLLYFSVKTIKKADNFRDSFFILILFFALVGYMVDSFFAFPRERIELQIFLNIIVAFIVFEYNKKFKTTKETKTQISIKAYAIVALCLLSITSFATYKRLKSEIGVNRIYAYNKINRHDLIVKTADEIYSPFSTISPFCDPIMQIKAISMYQTKSDLSLVLEALDKSLKDSPYHVETLNGLAMIHQSNKNYPKALEYSNKALMHAPSDTRTVIINSNILLNTDKLDEAYKILKTIRPKGSEEYKRSVNFIVLKKLRDMMSETKNEYFRMLVSKAVEQPNFLFKIHSKSIKKNEDFEKTLLETIFSTCEQDKIINDESIKQLKMKYKIQN